MDPKQQSDTFIYLGATKGITGGSNIGIYKKHPFQELQSINTLLIKIQRQRG